MHHLHMNGIYLLFFFPFKVEKYIKGGLSHLNQNYFGASARTFLYQLLLPSPGIEYFSLTKISQHASRESRWYYSKIKIKIQSILKSHRK